MNVVELSKQLIQRPSITPEDHGCQDMLIALLLGAGFEVIDLQHGAVKNFFAYHGSGQPHLMFAGHTDVVPPGPETQWRFPPFSATEHQGTLFGRGAADMKSATAAMTLAAIDFVRQHPQHPGTISFAITSDEEGPATDGTIKIKEYLQTIKKIPDYVLVGEASSNERIGDAIKVGRRGSLHGHLIIHGTQGHIAYPHSADNAIHRAAAVIQHLSQIIWDPGNADFSPTTLQFHSIQSGVASNVVPGELTASFNMRFGPGTNSVALENALHQAIKETGCRYTLTVESSAEPFFSGDSTLSHICQQAIAEQIHITPECNTTGGTSDGRHFAPLGCQIVELGAVNTTIHQINEQIQIDELCQLQHIYQRILQLSLNA